MGEQVREQIMDWQVSKTAMAPVVGVLLSLLLLSGCSSPSLEAPTPPSVVLSEQGLQQVVNATVDEVILPDLTAWQTQAQLFLEGAQSFCDKPSGENLQLLRARYQMLSVQWNRSMVFDFGPLRDNLFFPKIHFIESSRQRGTDYSGAIKTHIAQRLNDETVLDKRYFEKLKFTLVGMPALEVLLYEQGVDERVASYQQARKCQLLTGLATLNADNADYVVNGWQVPQATQTGEDLSYRELFFNNQLADGEKSLTKLIFAMQDYLRYIKQRKLNTKIDTTLSGLSYQNLHAGLDAIEDAFTLKHSGYSLFDYMVKADKSAVAKQFVSEVTAAKRAVEQQSIGAMKVHYGALIKLLESEVPAALGVNLGMNFVDGD